MLRRYSASTARPAAVGVAAPAAHAVQRRFHSGLDAPSFDNGTGQRRTTKTDPPLYPASPMPRYKGPKTSWNGRGHLGAPLVDRWNVGENHGPAPSTILFFLLVATYTVHVLTR